MKKYYEADIPDSGGYSNSTRQNGRYILTEDELYKVISRAMTTALGDDFITPKELLEKVKMEIEELKRKA